MKSIIQMEAVLARQKLAIFSTALFMGLAFMCTNASAADLKQTGKNAAGQFINLLLIFILLIGAVTMVLGILSWSTNISWLAQVGTKKIFVGGGAVIGALLFVMAFTFIYQTMAGAGGSLNMQWPF